MSLNEEFVDVLKHNYFDNNFELEQLKNGDVNTTFLVTVDSNEKYIAQRLSPFISEEMANDYLNYEKVCEENGVRIPKVIKTKSGELCFKSDDNRVYRVYEYIENDKPTKSPEFFEKLGEYLAKLHKSFENLENPVLCTIENFHEYKHYHDKLNKVKDTDEQKYNEAKEYIDFVLETLPKYYINETDKTYIHGDPKIDNFLYKDNECIATIDFDTVLYRSVYIDIGDALWSWCKNDDSTFNFDYFKASIRGYQKVNNTITEEESLNATRLIILELTSRFLIDYFEECYFAYNFDGRFDSKKDYLLHRAVELISLFKSTL